MRYLSKILMASLCIISTHSVLAAESQTQYGLSKKLSSTGNEVYVVLFNQTTDTFTSTATYYNSGKKDAAKTLYPAGTGRDILTHTIVKPTDYKVCLDVVRDRDRLPVIQGCFAPTTRIDVYIKDNMAGNNNKPIVTVSQK
jgi:hypothetical protein